MAAAVPTRQCCVGSQSPACKPAFFPKCIMVVESSNAECGALIIRLSASRGCGGGSEYRYEFLGGTQRFS